MKIIELAHLRNKLNMNKFDDKEKKLLAEIKENILQKNSPFQEIAINAINNCVKDIANADFKSATNEIQLIHNFTFDSLKSWDEDYFLRIELLSYLEQASDSERIKKLILLLPSILDIQNNPL